MIGIVCHDGLPHASKGVNCLGVHTRMREPNAIELDKARMSRIGIGCMLESLTPYLDGP